MVGYLSDSGVRTVVWRTTALLWKQQVDHVGDAHGHHFLETAVNDPSRCLVYLQA